jgi:hypothetical protein
VWSRCGGGGGGGLGMVRGRKELKSVNIRVIEQIFLFTYLKHLKIPP